MTLRRMLIAASVLLPAGLAPAGQIPAPETGPAQVNCRIVEDQLEMRDAATGAYLIAVQGFKMVRDSGPGVVSQVTLQSQPTGADLIVKLSNTSSQPQKAGSISTGIYNLGHEIEYLDSRRVSKFVTTNRDAVAWASFAVQYPDAQYSPVTVLKNDQMAFGISIQYPVMEYKHDVLVGHLSPPNAFAQGPAGRGWMQMFTLSNMGGESEHTRMSNPCLIPPGESRTYVVSIRVTRDVDNWITTLLPYRNYFREMYGGVQYQRRTAPIQGFSAAMDINMSDSNPYGFRADVRPDLNGWGPFVDLLNRDQWKSKMIWTLSGWNRVNQHLNFPYLVASPLRNHPKLATIFDPNVGLARAATDGREVGVWWGRCLHLCREWDTNEAMHFNPDNPEHAAIQLREMQAIYDTGARIVGLDTCNHKITPIWKTIPWIRDMQSRFPGVTFVTEPAMCDIMNLVAATYVEAIDVYERPSSLSEIYYITGPHVLADLVVPGHEHWSSLFYHLHKRYFNFEASPALIEADVRRLASWGYVPILFVEQDSPRNVVMARSWETTLPRAIVDNDPYIQNIKNGRLPNYVPPVPAPAAPPPVTQPPSPPQAQPQPQPAPQPGAGGSTANQPRLGQPQRNGPVRRTTGFLGIRPSTKPVTGGQPPAGGPSSNPSLGSGSAGSPGNQPRIAVTVTQRFNRKVRNLQLQADRTKGLIDAMNKQAREYEED